MFGQKMYLPKTYKPCKKRTCSMQINRVITVLPFSRPNFHRVQCKIDDPYVGIDDLRMRIYLQHRRCFPLPVIVVKLFFFIKCLAAHITRAFHLTTTIFCSLLVWIRTTNVPNFSQIGRQISELLKVKILDILHQLRRLI